MSFNDFVNISREPRAPDAPKRVWRDWAILAVAVPAAIVEVFVNPEVVHPVASLVSTLALLPTVLWRRTHPLAVVVVATGFAMVSNLFALIGDGPLDMYSLAVMAVLPYSLFRWGSGREAMIGLGLFLITTAISMAIEWNGFGEALGGLLALLFLAELGMVVRYQAKSRRQAIEHAKSSTRERLARELHDSVAHHVSAIAIQAQGGRAIAATDPARAVEVLSVIEEEAARALTEMRNMVGALRDGESAGGVDGPDGAALAPQPGVSDISRLTELGPGPRIELELTGDLDGLRPAIDTALYRLAQESITNAMRHARNASRVMVRVEGAADQVELTVTDDGIHNPPPAATNGFGLVGMAERAKLLGGTLTAGPTPIGANGGGRGWRVNAVLPRNGSVDSNRNGTPT